MYPPLRMFLIVPLGLFHIDLSPNSFTRASSGPDIPHKIQYGLLGKLERHKYGQDQYKEGKELLGQRNSTAW